MNIIARIIGQAMLDQLRLHRSRGDQYEEECANLRAILKGEQDWRKNLLALLDAANARIATFEEADRAREEKKLKLKQRIFP